MGPEIPDVKMPPGTLYQDIKTPTPGHRSQTQKIWDKGSGKGSGNELLKTYPTSPSSPTDGPEQYDNTIEKQQQQAATTAKGKKDEEEEMENKVDPLVSLFTMIMTGTLPVSSKKLDR